jgi:hypothetical protein
MHREFLFQNIYNFSKKDQILTDLSQKNSTLLPSFPRIFLGFFKTFSIVGIQRCHFHQHWINGFHINHLPIDAEDHDDYVFIFYPQH